MTDWDDLDVYIGDMIGTTSMSLEVLDYVPLSTVKRLCMYEVPGSNMLDKKKKSINRSHPTRQYRR